MVDIEICICADHAASVRRSVEAARAGGAARVELCALMEQDGLTPNSRCVRAAINSRLNITTGRLHEKPLRMVMVRPRGGDFCYSAKEIVQMVCQVEEAARLGADGVVLGVLNNQPRGLRIDLRSMERLVETAQEAGLQVTFHRAFDALPGMEDAIEALVDLGVQRVLTAGVPWGQKGSAVDGLGRLRRTLEFAEGRIEIVVGGGVNPGNVPVILAGLAEVGGRFSLHAYSGAQEEGETTQAAVRRLVEAGR